LHTSLLVYNSVGSEVIGENHHRLALILAGDYVLKYNAFHIFRNSVVDTMNSVGIKKSKIRI